MKSRTAATQVQLVTESTQSVGTQSIGRGFVHTVFTNVTLAGLGLLSGTLAARVLGPAGRGELAAIQTWPTIISVFSALGLSDALVYYCARQRDRAGTYMATAVIAALCTSIPAILLGYLVLPLVLSAQSETTISAARWYLAFIPISAIAALPLNPLQGLGQLFAWNLLRLVSAIGWLSVLLLAWVYQPVQPRQLAAGYLLFLALMSFPVGYFVWKKVPGTFIPDLQRLRRMLTFGLPSALTNVPQILNLRLDQMLMAGLLPANFLGLYVSAVGWSGATQPLLNAVGKVLFPHVAAQKERDDQIDAFTVGSRLGLIAGATVAFGVALITPWGVRCLFGSAFAAATPAAVILVIAGGISGWNGILEDGLRGLGHVRVILHAEIAGMVITSLSLLLFLQPFDILGAAASSLFGYATVNVFLILGGRRATASLLTDLIRPTRSDAVMLWNNAIFEIKAARRLR
jgi:O-antigen/teichoic acid export membrane protein